MGTTTYFLGAGVGLSILTLFMDRGNAGASVSVLSLIILAVYALIGLLWLLIYQTKNTSVKADVLLEPSQSLHDVF